LSKSQPGPTAVKTAEQKRIEQLEKVAKSLPDGITERLACNVLSLCRNTVQPKALGAHERLEVKNG